MEQHTAKRLRYSFLFLLPAIVLFTFVIFVQSQIIFGQAEDMMGETPKEIITPCGENELATLGANGLRCVKAERAPTTKDINITTTSCPFGIKNFSIDSSRTLSYTCVAPAVCGKNQFLSAQAGPTFTCIGYDIPILKDKFCPLANKISGFDEEGLPICTPIPNPLVGISCPEGQYLKGVGKHGLYMIGQDSDSLYVLDPEATGKSPATRIGKDFHFGVQDGEGTPRSITSHNGKLYLIGQGSDSLYVLDPEATGKSPATRIGERFRTERDPVSITSHNGKLYMIGYRSDSLYELNTEATGDPATIVGERFRLEATPISITSHNDKLYMIGQGSDSLYELNTEATGDPATRIGKRFGGVEGRPISITSHNGKLYMIGWGSDSLYELNTEATAEESPAKKIGKSFRSMEDSPLSITSYNGKLYMIGHSSDSLYELNTEVTAEKSPAKIVGTTFGVQGGEDAPRSITSRSIATRDPICVNF